MELPPSWARPLVAVHRNLGRVHIQHDALRGIEGYRFADQFAVDAGQAAKVLFLGQHIGLERLQARPCFARVIREAEPYFAMFPK